MGKFKQSLILFLTFLKIGAFTFGGGYAMIPLIESEVIEKHSWLSKRDLLDVITISESTPGPIAVNAATFVGYKVAGVLGSTFATIGLILPSFLIILLISFFFNQIYQFEIIQKAFKGIRVGVIVLLFMAVLSLAKTVKKNKYFYIALILALITSILFTIFIPSFSYISIILILLGLIIGIVFTSINVKKGDQK